MYFIIGIALTVIGLGLMTIFLIDKIKKYSVRETILKAFASMCFVGVAVTFTYAAGFWSEGKATWGVFAIVGLVFGMLGDIWLDLKYVFPEHDKEFTYAGFISFGIGHMFYISGMFLQYYVPGDLHFLYIISPFVFGLLMGLVTVLMEKPLKLKYGSMKLIVFIYGTLLFSMFGVALSMLILHGGRALPLILLTVGGGLFAISDLILSGTYFGEGHEKPFDITINTVTYYLAQFVIAFSIFFTGAM